MGKEFTNQGIPFKAPPVLGIKYKGESLEKKYQSDYVCYDEIIVEIKAIVDLSGTEEAQIINYLKASGLEIGLLINFGASGLQYKRFVFTHKTLCNLPARALQWQAGL